MYMFLTIRNVAKYRSLSSDLHFNTTPKHLAALWNPTCGMLPSPLVPAQAAWGFVQVGVEHLQGGRILQPPWACCSFQCSTTLSAKQKITASHQNLSCFNTSVLPLPTSGKTWAPSSPHPPSIAAYTREVLPESPFLRAEQTQLSQQLPPLRNSSHTIPWQPSTSPELVFHFLGMGSPKWGRVNKHRD